MTVVPPKENAFTIVELVMVSAVLLTLSSLALRSMFFFSEQRKLRTAAVELSGYLQVARNVANAQNAPCIIALTNNDGGIFSPDPSAGNACKDGTIQPAVRLRSHSGSRNLRATALSGGGGFPLTFTPEGTVRQGTTVLISSSDVPEGAWCVDVQAPLATVRLGWQSTGGTCNYAIEQ
jgi:Tfp pilus assembly protein FimT